jgi:hypothetical protein
MSRAAAASTIPVTSVARQENSRNSFSILVAIVRSPVQRPLKRHSFQHTPVRAKRWHRP